MILILVHLDYLVFSSSLKTRKWSGTLDWRVPNHNRYLLCLYYFSSTSAPAASMVFFRFSASSLERPSLTVAGAPSTRSLASFRPRPQASFTAFTTWSLAAPADFRTTSKEDFSSAAAASPAPAAGPAATATAAAAGSIPYSSFRTVANSLTSFTVRFTNSSAIALISAILHS